MHDLIQTYRDAEKLVEGARNILLLSHKRPDGDTLGATCALNIALQNMGKHTKMACVDTPTERFSFLPNIRKFEKEFDFRSFDLIIASDVGAHYMTQYHEIYPGIFSGEISVINIDHHASNDHFGSVNMVDPNSASATVILYKWFRFLNIVMSPSIATSLLAGIYNDTGSFMHSNATYEVFQIAADLVRKGGKVYPISRYMFKSATVSSLKLWGRVLENMKITPENAVIAVLTKKDFDECGADSEESSGVIDFLNSVPGTKFALLLTEDEKGRVKGSFRTQREDIDLSALAGLFGGGGHKKAAGFSIPGKIEKEVRWKIISPTGEEISPIMLRA